MGKGGLWEEYCELCNAFKKLIIEKKLNIWNEVVERANSDFEVNKKEFWAFVSKRTKGRKKGISSLRNEAGGSVSNTKGKLQVLQGHYQRLGSSSVDEAFDDCWEQEVDSKVGECSLLSQAYDDSVFRWANTTRGDSKVCGSA